MKSLFRRLPAILYASLLALIVLGILFRPILDVGTEAHLAEHEIVAAHGHADRVLDAAPSCRFDADLERAHGLVHQEGSGNVCADLAVDLQIPLLLFGPDFGMSREVIAIPASHLATPFKPPIA